jgi:hypothetical protein
MKKGVLLFVLCLSALLAKSQTCFWAQAGSGSNSEEAKDVATDNLGNVYITGTFESSSITFGSITLTATSGTNLFVVKYDAAGTVQWAKTATGIAEGYGITTDAAGDILVSGYFDGSSTTFSGITLTNQGGGDAFILKYDTDGNIIWAESIGGVENTEYAYDITTDLANAVYITGRYTSSSLTIGSTVLTNQGTSGPDIFIAKFDSSGNPLWADGPGGNFTDIANSIACDDNANVYITGSFSSDAVTFGSTTLTGQGTGATSMFVAKYDSTGAAVWANKTESYLGEVFAKEITSDGLCTYVQGEFHGESITFGSDVLMNAATGSPDIFIIKLNPNGNAIWAKAHTGNYSDYSGGLSTDAAGNIYAIGNFTSTSLDVSSDTTINNASFSSYNNAYITKYDSTGTNQWAQVVGSVHTHGRAIAAGPGSDVYFTGDFLTSASFGSTTLTAAGGYDAYVADIIEFNAGVSSVIDASCFGASDGSAESFVTGGHSPYTYLWSTTPTQSTEDASGIPAGTYSLTVTEAYGCEQTANFTITEPDADSALICMVTVDALSQHNIIIWDKSSFTTVDSFIVYREISTANYQPIAVIPYDSLSQFVDTVSTLYFPNTGNPNVGTYRYKIQAKSACGTTGPMSPYHNTIFITNTGGTFTWPQLYVIEGAANPVISYVLMRDDLSDGNWNAVGSVAGTQSFIIDPDYATYASTASWRVETVWSIDCTPTKTFSTSYSNRSTNAVNTLNENSATDFVTIYPNPFSGSTLISYSLSNNSSVSLVVYNEIGQVVETIVSSEQTAGSYQYNFDASKNGFNPGVYYVQIIVDEKTFLKKIVLI